MYRATVVHHPNEVPEKPQMMQRIPLDQRVAWNPKLVPTFLLWTRQLSFPCAASNIQHKVTKSIFFQASSSPHVYRAVVVQHLDQVKIMLLFFFILTMWMCPFLVIPRQLFKNYGNSDNMHFISLAAPDAIEPPLSVNWSVLLFPSMV